MEFLEYDDVLSSARLIKEGTQEINEFITQYIEFSAEIMNSMLKTNLEYTGCEKIQSFERELLVSQTLCDDRGANNVFIGLHMDTNTAAYLADKYYELIALQYNASKPERISFTDIVDFCEELLNTMDCPCTYRLSIDYTLRLPMHTRDAVCKAPQIYRLNFSENELEITIFVIFGKNYTIEGINDDQ
ncbi:hypothetical protein AGMMS49975_04560 [Clostridia bacterium]|nr:hypothetical protein AGMMS49975_04560 [Clostridia bacterium]